MHLIYYEDKNNSWNFMYKSLLFTRYIFKISWYIASSLLKLSTLVK